MISAARGRPQVDIRAAIMPRPSALAVRPRTGMTSGSRARVADWVTVRSRRSSPMGLPSRSATGVPSTLCSAPKMGSAASLTADTVASTVAIMNAAPTPGSASRAQLSNMPIPHVAQTRVRGAPSSSCGGSSAGSPQREQKRIALARPATDVNE